MDAVEYLKEKTRMCKYPCSNCAIKDENKNQKAFESCVQFEKKYPEQAVETVEKWSKEHPVKTFADVFFERMPNASRSISKIPATNINGKVCPYQFFKIEYKCKFTDCTKCWHQEYKEEI
jgi:hypothetical protein